MAVKLYPPYIEGTIPAFEGTTMVVPFSLNKANSSNSIHSMFLKVKSVQGNTVIQVGVSSRSFNLESGIVTFSIDPTKYIVGQYYKIQIAFADKNGTVGYYSTTGVIKYSTKPTLQIQGLLKVPAINEHNLYNYTCHYSQQGKDINEKMYSCHFKIIEQTEDEKETVFYDSGDVVHNASNDNNVYESYDTFLVTKEFEPNKSYSASFTVTTTNNMVITSPYYLIKETVTTSGNISDDLIPILDFDNGWIELYMSKKTGTGATGTFLLSRSEDNGKTWERLLSINITDNQKQKLLWIDKTVRHGVTYLYAIQSYTASNKTYSNKKQSIPIICDFEDVFLSDGSCQLKIRYNTKVSSFKTTFLENKTDTIGSQYPFFFRNGNVLYHEFPISGLLSYVSDWDNTFANLNEPIEHLYRSSTNNTKVKTNPSKTTYEIDNLNKEREFKMKVLDWLNNGKMKLFRSPTEGNYLVRIQNVSLTPNDTLGRKIHTFSANACEVADFTVKNLQENDFIK